MSTRTHSSLLLLASAIALACNGRSSVEGSPESRAPRPSRSRSTPPTIVPAPSVEPDTLTASSHHLFALNPNASSLSIFDSTQVAARATSSFDNTLLPLAKRRLLASQYRDLAYVLFPDLGQLYLVCPRTGNAPRVLSTGVVQGADSVAELNVKGEPYLLAYASRRADSPSSPPSVVSLLGPIACNQDLPPSTPLPVGDGPHEVVVENSDPTAPGGVAYVASTGGVFEIDPSRAAASSQLSAASMTDLLISAQAQHVWLVGRGPGGILALDARGDEPLPRPLAGPAAPLGAGGASGDGDGAAAGQGGEGQAGAPNARPEGTESNEMSGGRLLPGTSAFALARSGSFVLAADGTRVVRQNLTNEATPPTAVDVAVDHLALGNVDDCAIGYRERERSLVRLELSASEAEPVDESPLRALEIPLERKVSWATLICHPDVGGKPSCCAGLALVVYEEEPSPLGQTQAYSLVDLRDGHYDLRRSSLRVSGLSTLDQGGALLLTLSHAGVRHQISLLAPFVDGELSQLDIELTDAPTAVGYVPGRAGYVSLLRQDGGVVFVTRKNPNTALSPSNYLLERVEDFRLNERTQPLEAK